MAPNLILLSRFFIHSYALNRFDMLLYGDGRDFNINFLNLMGLTIKRVRIRVISALLYENNPIPAT
ncbi:hypothetical protein, partial [Bacillus thuringiensis]|uniref:hypothetical protein n=1 Tax=Bacillus thuringiensis TaxID=1428 RepID=UPI00285259D5